MNEQDLEPVAPPDPVSTTDLVFPNQTNFHGNMFGGSLVSLMDKLAFTAATRFFSRTWVTASMEAIDFHQPIREGQIVELCARVVYSGGHSATVKVEAYGEDPQSGERYHCCTGYFNLVALDVNGNPTEVPELMLETDEQREEYEKALEVRKATKERIARWEKIEEGTTPEPGAG